MRKSKNIESTEQILLRVSDGISKLEQYRYFYVKYSLKKSPINKPYYELCKLIDNICDHYMLWDVFTDGMWVPPNKLNNYLMNLMIDVCDSFGSNIVIGRHYQDDEISLENFVENKLQEKYPDFTCIHASKIHNTYVLLNRIGITECMMKVIKVQEYLLSNDGRRLEQNIKSISTRLENKRTFSNEAIKSLDREDVKKLIDKYCMEGIKYVMYIIQKECGVELYGEDSNSTPRSKYERAYKKLKPLVEQARMDKLKKNPEK